MESQINIFENANLINLIKNSFNDDDNKLFTLSFKLYSSTKDNPDDFLINFDDIYKWIGFSRKSDAKKLLINNFTINKDYKIDKLIAAAIAAAIKSKGGENKEYICLTINCFKKFCMKASTKQADKIYDYYIKMEEIIFKYIQEQFIEQQNIIHQKNNILELKDKEIDDKDKLLELKEQEINYIKNKKYDEAEKIGSIYIFTTDKQNIHKVGKSKSVIRRKNDLQTAIVDDIQLIYEYKTSNDTLLESIVHDILKDYRCKSNREHFWCNTNYIKTIIEISGKTLDVLKSTYEYISKEELFKILYDKLNINEDNIIEINNNDVNEDNITDTHNNDLTENNSVKLWLHSYYDITDNTNDRINASDLYNSYIHDNNSKLSIVKFSKYIKHNNIEYIKPKNKTVYIKIKRKNDVYSDSDNL
jgi:hypothetical protein